MNYRTLKPFHQEAFDRLSPEDLDPHYYDDEREEDEEDEYNEEGEEEEETLPDPDELALLIHDEDLLFLVGKKSDYDDNDFLSYRN